MAEAPLLRVGFLSAANIAHKELRALAMSEGIEVLAIASRDLGKAEAMVQRWKLSSTCKPLSSYEELFEVEGLDALYIPLPSALHLPWVQKAAAKGLHVLLEKPISVTAEDAEAIVRVCKEAGVQLMDGNMWVHNPRAADIAAAKGNLGAMRDVHAVFTFKASEAWLQKDIRCKSDLDPLGALGDLGWYCVRACLLAYDWQPPALVQAHAGATFTAEGVPLHCGATLVWPDGGRGHIECGFDAALLQHVILHGTEGTIQVNDFVVPRNEFRAAYLHTHDHCLKEEETYDATEIDEKTLILQKPQELLMWEEFARCVQTIKSGGEPNRHWPRLSLLTQKILCTILESLRSNCKAVPFEWTEP